MTSNPMPKKATLSPKSGNLLLPAMRMMFASLVEPAFPSRKERDPKKKAWQITGLVPADADLTVAKAEFDRVVSENLAPAQVGKIKVKYPVLKTEDIGSLASYADEYPFCIRMNARQFTHDGRKRPQPEVVQADKSAFDPETEADEVYNGRWFRPSVNPYFWTDDAGGKGVSFGLVNVQLLDHDEPLAGGKVSAANDFDAVGDGLADLEG